MDLNDKDRAELEEVAERSARGILASRVFLSLMSEGMAKDPVAALQLGIAVLLDKPIIAVVLDGTKVPEHIKNIAAAIEYVKDTTDIQQATETVIKALEAGKKPTTPNRAAYLKGVEDGLRAFSYMKDGTSYVGTCGTTLKHAIEMLHDGKLSL